jgi:cytochrome c oxidase subunit 2
MPAWFPKSISTFGSEIDSVFLLIFYITGIGFVLSEAVILYFVLRYRRKEGRRASFIEGEKFSELAWILVPTAIVLVLDFGIDFAGAKAWSEVKGEAPPSDIEVRCTGKQFNWNFTYPGPDGNFGTADDLALENDLHVPVGKVVRFTFGAEDVIHSFFVPVLRLKQDCLPGRQISGWFQATETGQYEIACAELCGYGHYTMRGLLYVHSSEEYDEWMKAQWPASTGQAQGIL